MPKIRNNPPTTARRTIAAWFGILALALPMLVPVAQGIPLAGLSDNSQEPFYMVLCKAMQKGTGGGDNGPEKTPDMSDCPVCIGFAFGKTVLTSPLASNPIPENRFVAVVFDWADETRHGRRVSKTCARAPPVSA